MRAGPNAAAELPPLITASWIRLNARALTEPQRNGETCCYCGQEPRTRVPVGNLGARQLFACMPACEAAYGPDRP